MEVKNILVPIDFSKCSKNALKTAIKLAKVNEAKIHLVNAIHVHTPHPDLSGGSLLESIISDYENQVKQSFEELESEIIELQDIPLIARGQMAAEDALAFNANRILFCDTDLLTTSIWSNWLFQSCPGWITEEADRREYDLYLLTDVDVPWVEDQVRYLPEERRSFFEHCRQQLEDRHRKYHVIKGSWKDRLASAIAAVETLLNG